MSLETPTKIRMLQRKLYQKAKEEPSYRFYLLYDKMHREDVLAHAYALVKSNQGAPGVDGQSFWGIESQGLEDCRSGHAASDQDVVKGAGRGAGQKRQTAGERWEGKQLWHAAGRSH